MDLDVLFRRETVLEIILSGKHISPEVYQLRFHLFLRAAKCCFDVRQKRREVLEPFPYFFYDRDTKQRNYDELESCILSIPQLSTITVRNWFLVLLHVVMGQRFYRNIFVCDTGKHLTSRTDMATDTLDIHEPIEDKKCQYKRTKRTYDK